MRLLLLLAAVGALTTVVACQNQAEYRHECVSLRAQDGGYCTRPSYGMTLSPQLTG
jgi:hypothetical protein